MKLQVVVLKEAVAPRKNKDFELVAAKGAGPAVQSDIAVEVRETNEQDRRDLRNEPGVFAAAPQMPVALIKSISSDPVKAPRDGADAPKESWGIAAVNAHDSKLTGQGVTVAVLDTGIDQNHAAFKGVTLDRRNFTAESDDDTDGHGTHCAGTIFGRDVDDYRIGIARGITKALIGKVIGKNGGSTENIVKAIKWAQANDAQVISMSLGLDFVGFQKMLQTVHGLPEAQATAIALAGYADNVRMFDKLSGVTSSDAAIINSAVVAAAAGNESVRPQYAVGASPPARAEFFLSIAALGPGTDGDPSYRIADFSNSDARFAAPGVNILSAKSGGGLVPMSGTSQATPHVAGVAALWVEKLGDKFNAARVIDLMKKNCVALTPGITEDDVRYGLVQAPSQ